MHDLLENGIFNFSMALTAVWIVNRFWKCFFEKRKNSFLSVAICVLYCGFQIQFQYKRGSINLLQSMINVVLIFLIVICRYHCAGKRKYFLLFLFYILQCFFLFIFFIYLHLNFTTANIQ